MITGEDNLSKRIEEIMMELVSVKSDTGTSEEREIEKYIYQWFKNLEYFKHNSDYFGKYSLKDDYLNRSVVWALVKGNGKNTVVFLHHHDAVDVYDYGVLSDYACNPKVLNEKIGSMPISEEVRYDLESGEWIFGRGTCDMKGGAAIQMALMEKYSKDENFQGNILLLSVPDEESLSAGMRGGAELLKELKDRFSLDYTALINSEPHQRDHRDTGIIYEGSVGKTMPVVYVRGKKTHIGDIFQGFNAVVLLSEIVKRTELNPYLSDVVGNEVSPPPSWSFARDGKESYDASIPPSAGGYFSILTMTRTPKDILEQLKNISQDAFESVIKEMNEKYKVFREKAGKKAEKLPWKSNVKTFAEIYEEAIKDSGNKFIDDFNKTVKKLKEDIKDNKINIPESNFVLIKKVLEYINDLSPVVVIAFSPPYYPHIANLNIEGTDSTIKLTEKLNNFAKDNFNESYEKRNYFMGISDLSYAALNDSDEVIPYIGPNMPLWEKLYTVPFEAMKELSLPSFIIGPWGKDLHKFTERVHRRDLIEKAPAVIEFALKELF